MVNNIILNGTIAYKYNEIIAMRWHIYGCTVAHNMVHPIRDPSTG